jgi:16S rRNA (cytosine1402-N4)-methyltransferase
MAKNGLVAIITKKPLVPSEDERDANPSSRSAKLRVVEKV